MAEPIDELSLKIDIDVQKDIHKTISSLARAITKLNNAVSDVSALDKYAKTLSKITTGTVKVINGTSIAKATKASVEPEYTDIDETATSTSQELNNISTNGAKASEAINEVGKETAKTKKKMEDAKKTNDKYSKTFSKLIRSIGRIAFYRAIRTAIKEVADAFREGFSNFVKYDKETNQAMSNVINSVNQLKNSLGVGLGSVLQMLEPLIVTISDGLTNMVNGLNMALAKMQGKSTYQKAIKQNEDYAKSLDKANSSLLSFDKFEALSNKKEESPFEEVKITDETNEVFDIFTAIFEVVQKLIKGIRELWQTLSPILKNIIDLVLVIFDTIAPLIEPIVDIVNTIIQVLTPAINSLIGIIKSIVQVVGGVLQNVSGVIQIISGLVKLLTLDFQGAWESIANGFASMVNGIANMFIGLVNFCIDALNLILKPIDAIAGIFGGNVEIPHWNAKVNWQPYADGGMVPTGTTFIAGEAGAEVVHTSSSGTGVTNIEQFTNAMYNALSMYGAARGTDVSFNGDVYIDKTKAGQLFESSVYNEGVRVGHFSRR